MMIITMNTVKSRVAGYEIRHNIRDTVKRGAVRAIDRCGDFKYVFNSNLLFICFHLRLKVVNISGNDSIISL